MRAGERGPDKPNTLRILDLLLFHTTITNLWVFELSAPGPWPSYPDLGPRPSKSFNLAQPPST